METYETYIDKVGIGDKSGSPVGFHQITRAKSILYQLPPNQSPELRFQAGRCFLSTESLNTD